jgi:hypothetical protein
VAAAPLQTSGTAPRCGQPASQPAGQRGGHSELTLEAVMPGVPTAGQRAAALSQHGGYRSWGSQREQSP